MKRIFYSISFILIALSCETPRQQQERKSIELNVIEGYRTDSFYIITLQDGCDYVVLTNNNGVSFMHKPKCSNH